jgi:hypothetical protein
VHRIALRATAGCAFRKETLETRRAGPHRRKFDVCVDFWAFGTSKVNVCLRGGQHTQFQSRRSGFWRFPIPPWIRD